LIFFVKFLGVNKKYFIKIDTKIMLITQTKQIIFINNFNLDEKTWFIL